MLRKALRPDFAGAILTIAIVAMSWSCERKPAPKPVFMVWKMVGSWPGHGNAQTESFEEFGQWRIKWETHNEKSPGTGHFKVSVRSAISGRVIAIPVEHEGVGHDIAYVNEDPRVYYLGIDSSGVDWTVTVEDPGLSDKPAEPE